jgi:PIN domain nuclease of toxin-antitoxin system
MSGVVSDTHAQLWYLANDARLSRNAGEAFESSIQDGKIYVPSICVVEAAYLVEKGRISEAHWVQIVRIVEEDSPFEPVELTIQIAKAIRLVSRTSVPDLPDRVIAATAVALNLPLVARDAHIRALPIQTIW